MCPMYAQLSLFTKSPLEHSPTTTPYHLYRNDFLCMPEKKPPPLSLLVTYSHSEKMIGSQRCIIKNGKYQVASAQEVGRHSSCMRSVGTKKCCQRLIHHRLYQSQPSNRQAGITRMHNALQLQYHNTCAVRWIWAAAASRDMLDSDLRWRAGGEWMTAFNSGGGQRGECMRTRSCIWIGYISR